MRLSTLVPHPSATFLCAAVLSISVGLVIASENPDAKPGEIQMRARPAAEKPVATTVNPAAAQGRVVVKFVDEGEIRLVNDRLTSRRGLPTDDAESVLGSYTPGQLNRLFVSIETNKLDNERKILQAAIGQALPDLNSYYTIEVASPSEASTIINNLNALEIVEIAYYQPFPEPAGDIDPPTPDYQPNQDYREAAPAGVDADYANTVPGGDGAGVKIIDVEGAWQDTHEDLDKALGGEISGSQIDDPSWRNHGTAVIGEMIGGDNGYGVTGICPGADIGMVSIATLSTAEAIMTATDNLEPGDLILIELHAPGPHYDFESREDQAGYICMEYWQANFDAMLYAWARGVTVVEAAGNGGENFDDAGIYGVVFDTTYRNSHAVMVGAGWHAASAYDRQKHGYSNYGERVNLQGYGSGVYTCGYGGLFAPNGDENQYYTASFSGTSSASPIVTGACACLQGFYKATYGTYVTADIIRDVLVASGSPQLGDTSKHIGPRPDLYAAMSSPLLPPSLYTSPLYIDTVLTDQDIGTKTVWLHNRSVTTSAGFLINAVDSLNTPYVADWLTVSPEAGSVPAADSVPLTVTLDATLLSAGVGAFQGVLKIGWSSGPSTSDSVAFVPVFLEVPCADDSYLAFNTDDPGEPDYQWIDAVSLGSRISDGEFYNSQAGSPLDDGTTGPHAVGFDFRFYGVDYSQVYIAVNGALSFTDSEVNVNGYYSGLTIPGAPFSTFIAGFYADLLIDAGAYPGSGIYLYQPNGDTLVIQWHNVANFNSSGTSADFEIILTSEGNIMVQFQDVESTGLSSRALVGIQTEGCYALGYHSADGPIEHQPADAGGAQFKVNASGCCEGRTGNINCDPLDATDIGDLTRLIDYLFILYAPLCCEAEADVNGDGQVDIGDLTRLIDRLFISYDNLEWCLP